MTEAITCNNKLRKLMTEGEGRGCCVMIWVIIWVIILARVWESMMRYISIEADWFKNEVVLKL